MQSLVAILLVVRSRPGPQLVYRYPQHAQRRSRKQHQRDQDDSSDSDSDADINGISSLRRSHKVKASLDSAQTTAQVNENAPATEEFLGFSEESLEKLLAPGIWSDRKKFEICLDGLTFVGHPIHAYEDGRWTKKAARGPHGMDHARAHSDADDQYGDYTNFGITVTEPLSPVRVARDFQHVPESFDSQLGRSLGTSMNSASSTSTTTPEQLSMFNVVFVFDCTSEGEEAGVVDGTYRHVVRKLSKALHYCQKQSGYVGVETRRLLSLHARAKQDHISSATLQQQTLDASELAWALKEVYESISAGKIAGIRLNGQAISLYLPHQDHNNSEADEPLALTPTIGLLLLEDKATLLRELAHPDASPLAQFIREHTPTKSLQKLSARLGISVDEVLHLSHHLIKWRKARAITPLHPRNTYTVPPSAPTDRLQQYMHEYARSFPGLPSLPQMLKFLSGKPIKYGMLMPSRDHRVPYMEILAYLVRHGFVVQVKTVGWLRRVGRRRGTLGDEDRSSNGKTEKGKGEVVNQNRMPLSVASLLSPQLRAVDDDVVSVSSERTAIPLSVAAERSRSSAAAAETLPVPTVDGGGKTKKEKEEEGEDDPWAIILNPVDPSDSDVEAMNNILDAVEDDELRDRLPSLWKYFDGEEALEGIAAREGLKRSLVERWMDVLGREGLVSTVRYI